MTAKSAFGSLLASELDETNYPEFRDRVRKIETEPVAHTSRTYGGFEKVTLPVPKPRRFASLDGTLLKRRSLRELRTTLPDRTELARILRYSHGALESDGRGPTPSAGKLCALELYIATFDDAWLPRGAYHYDRSGNHLSKIGSSPARNKWVLDVPSLDQCSGGSALLFLVSAFSRVEAKYGHRASKLALLEAGHLMQNLCLVATSLDRTVLPLGGFFERNLARRLGLHQSDALAYVGVLG